MPLLIDMFASRSLRSKRRQMYKIYINGRRLILLSDNELAESKVESDKTTLISAYTGKKKVFRQHVDLLMKSPEVAVAYIWAKDLAEMWQAFLEAFTLIVAAGGLVTNTRSEVLVFLRHRVWDLPKGKIDPGETPTEAAVREVQEECGLDKITLGEFICHSYHMYQAPNKAVLKKTWWYHMHTLENQLVPQIEEGIEIVQWETKASVRSRINDFFPNLHEVILFGTNDSE